MIPAMQNLGICRFALLDHGAAAASFHRAAEHGARPAMEILATIYSTGEGVEEGLTKRSFGGRRPGPRKTVPVVRNIACSARFAVHDLGQWRWMVLMTMVGATPLGSGLGAAIP